MLFLSWSGTSIEATEGLLGTGKEGVCVCGGGGGGGVADGLFGLYGSERCDELFSLLAKCDVCKAQPRATACLSHTTAVLVFDPRALPARTSVIEKMTRLSNNGTKSTMGN